MDSIVSYNTLYAAVTLPLRCTSYARLVWGNNEVPFPYYYAEIKVVQVIKSCASGVIACTFKWKEPREGNCRLKSRMPLIRLPIVTLKGDELWFQSQTKIQSFCSSPQLYNVLKSTIRVLILLPKAEFAVEDHSAAESLMELIWI
ncbi:hypothetical protein NC652_014630 [Populus alba x Populus x berolinensis]|nr:hypothetical protein NC652_014630 [Populus alba x Populus x berolinensis]